MKKFIAISISIFLVACGQDQAPSEPVEAVEVVEAVVVETAPSRDSQVQVDRFADIQVLSYKVPGFDELSLREKKLVYFLSQAALSGRDIIYDQNYSYNLRIRKLLSAVVATYGGDRSSEDYAA